MTALELNERVLKMGAELIPNFELSDLHKAMLMECCENAINAKSAGELTDDMRILIVARSLELCNSMIKALIVGAITDLGGDIVNLNYKGQHFKFDRNSTFVKNAIAEKSNDIS